MISEFDDDDFLLILRLFGMLKFVLWKEEKWNAALIINRNDLDIS